MSQVNMSEPPRKVLQTLTDQQKRVINPDLSAYQQAQAQAQMAGQRLARMLHLISPEMEADPQVQFDPAKGEFWKYDLPNEDTTLALVKDVQVVDPA